MGLRLPSCKPALSPDGRACLSALLRASRSGPVLGRNTAARTGNWHRPDPLDASTLLRPGTGALRQVPAVSVK